jgi:hypothetical protein
MTRAALVVGINTYTHFRALKAPAQDAEAIARRLQQDGEFKVTRLPEALIQGNDQLRPAIGETLAVPQAQLESALEQLFHPTSSQQVPDTALFYFSGHGLPDPKGYDKGYLATSDTDPNRPRLAISLRWLHWLLSESPIPNQIVWLDCCHSGGLLIDVEAAKPARRNDRSWCFIASSRDFEPSWQDLNSPYSVLTKSLLEGLNPTRLPGRWVDTYALVDYVNQALKGEQQTLTCTNDGDAINLTYTYQVVAESTQAGATSEDEHHDEKQDLRGYLSRLIQKYRWLKLQDLREAGSLQIELEKVYIALKAEPESEYELQQSSKLHETEVLEEAGVESTDVINSINLEDFEARNIRLTYKPARDGVKRARITEVHTFGDAFRQHHRIVVLGGPGSGKTTLGRWLALQLAKVQALALDEKTQKNVTVLRSQIDPDIGSESDEQADLGPARVPIFLRLSHYARELASLERDSKPAISLIDYLGRDPDSEELRDGMTADTRNKLFRAHLTSGDAVTILDGLDELSETNRGTVVSKIQDFILDHIPETDDSKENGLPCEMGGNQVIVTSRYVGYKYHPVRANCKHFGVQPMRRPAVERFVYAWSDAVNAVIDTSGLTEVDAVQLILEVYSANKPKVRELATNPLLITILATVYWRDGQLPDQRAGIYDRVVENLVEVWLKREECKQLTREQLMAALEPLAADLQENASNNGLVSLTRIAEIIEGPLAYVSGIDDPSDRRFREQLDGLLKTIRKHVGLLAEQSAGNYAFFHRTFQEFLAARHLLARPATAAQRIGEKLDDPIWREPLLLALGFVTINWGRESQLKLLTEVLEIDRQDDLIPRATFLLTDALLEIHKVPTEVVEQIVTRLLTSYSISMEQIQARGLRERIEQMFIRLRQGSQTDVVIHLLAEAVRRPGEKRDLTFAVANIVRQIDWYTDEIVDSLMLVVGRDSSDLEWPICQALIKALNKRPNEQRWIDTAPHKTFARLELAHLPMRKLLKMRPDLVAFVREDCDWLALLIALYGGLDQALSLTELQQYQQQPIEVAKFAVSKSPLLVEKEAVAPPVLPQVNFSPQFIFWDLQDTGLSRLVQRHLDQQRPARELINTFWHRWKHGSDVGAVEALVGLAALGEDIIPILRESLVDSVRQTVAQIALERFSQLRFLLAGPLIRTSEIILRTIPEGIPEQHQLDLLRIALDTHIACGGAALEVGTDWPEYNFISTKSPETKASLDAEFWAYVFSGALGNGREKGILASVIGSLATSRSDFLLQAWSQIPYAVNRTAQHHLAWPQPILAPRPSSPTECYLAMLDAMEGVPPEYHSVAGHVLAQCRSILDANPSLLWETISLCERHGEAFTRGYQTNRSAAWDETSEVQAALENWLTSIATAQERNLQPETMFEDGELGEYVSGASEPYLQFRAFGYFPEFLASEPEAFEIDLSKSINRIPEPVDRIRAVEFLLMGSPKLVTSAAGLPDLIDAVTHLLPEITDPENRARTFCRLAMFMPVQTEKLLSGAVEALESIPDLTRKAVTINEIRAVWGRAPGMAAALDAVAETIADPWERDKALGRVSRLVHTRRALGEVVPLAWRVCQTTRVKDCVYRKGSANGTLDWTLLYLVNIAKEVERLGRGPSNSDALWDDLLDNPSEAVAGLVASGLEAGLPITTRNASILDRVLQEDRADDLEPLWPYLGRPEPGAIATISRWSSRLGKPSQWSALVQAEAGRLTPEIVGSVIDLLGDSTDLLRLRASLALHGSTAHTENPARRWRISRVGAETLDVLAKEAKRSSNSQAMLTTITWVHHDIHYDSSKAVEKWLQEVCEEGEHSPAAWLLGGMESAEQEVVSVLLSGLPSAPPDAQEIILMALARLSHCSKGVGLPPGDIHKIIATVPEGIRTRLSILPEGTETLLNSVRDAVKETQSGYAWQQALMLMDKSSEWLDEESLGSREACIKRLQSIGAQKYVVAGQVRAGDVDIDAWKGPYWIKTDKAAAPLVQDERIQETLIALLAEMESTNNYLGYSNHLLTATEAIARKSPDTFARLASPEDWEPVFTEWVQYCDGWSERLAAVRLLGRLRRVTPRVAKALRAAIEDNPYTQHAAYAAVSEFRYIEGDVLQDVLSMLDSTSAATSAAAARLLVSAAKAGIDVDNRRRIINSLQEVVRKPSATRPVFLMDVAAFNGVMSPRFLGMLDETLYRSIFEISGA